MNTGLATLPVEPRTMHWARLDIDWNYPESYAQPVMLSWQNVRCWCRTPWAHY